jgi:hypothetical protein
VREPASIPLALDRALRPIEDPDRRIELVRRLRDAVADVRQGTADRLVLSARRMTVLYRLAVANGLEAPRDPDAVVSDRLIDLLPDRAWAAAGDRAAAKILAVDDIVITGGTSERLVSRCQRLVDSPGSVKPWPLWNIPEKAADQADRAHREFALTFTKSLLPYFTDFTMSERLTLPAATFDAILADRDWTAVDVTGAQVPGSRAGACSLYLGKEMEARLRETLGPASNLVDHAKIRLFFTFEHGKFEVRFVPIVLTRDLDRGSVERWLGHKDIDLASGRRGDPAAQCAAAGLITMILSTVLFQTFAEHEAARGRIGNMREDGDFAQLVLGQAFRRFADAGQAHTLSVLEPSGMGADGPGANPTGFTWPEGRVSEGTHYVRAGDDVVRPVFRRIGKVTRDESLSIRELCVSTDSSPRAVSVALDIGNDAGWCVPEHRVDGNRIIRGQRAAEAVGKCEAQPIGCAGGRLAAIPKMIEVPDREFYAGGRSSEDVGTR